MHEISRDVITMTTPKAVQPVRSEAGESNMTPEPPAQIDAVIQGAIGRRLRDSYGEIVNEKVPDDLLDVLKRLKEKEARGNAGEG